MPRPHEQVLRQDTPCVATKQARKPRDASTSSPLATKPGLSVPAGWFEGFDSKTFYYKSDGTIQWTRPAGLVAHKTPSPQDRKPRQRSQSPIRFYKSQNGADQRGYVTRTPSLPSPLLSFSAGAKRADSTVVSTSFTHISSGSPLRRPAIRSSPTSRNASFSPKRRSRSPRVTWQQVLTRIAGEPQLRGNRSQSESQARQRVAVEQTPDLPHYESIYELLLAASVLLERRFSNLDKDRLGTVWFGNFERFLSHNGCPDTSALRLAFERTDGGSGFLNFKGWLALCAQSTTTDLQYFFHTPGNAHVVAQAMSAVQYQMLKLDTSRTFALSKDQAKQWASSWLSVTDSVAPPAATTARTSQREELIDSCLDIARSPQAAARDEGLVVEDLLYSAYLLLVSISAPSLRGEYTCPSKLAPPRVSLASIAECFRVLEADFAVFDTTGDGYVDASVIAKCMPPSIKCVPSLNSRTPQPLCSSEPSTSSIQPQPHSFN